MVTTENGTTSTTGTTKEVETRQRTRINPRLKMVKALHSILGENLRENDLDKAQETADELLSYIKELNGD